MRYQDLSGVTPGDSSAVIRDRVITARRIQQERFKGLRRVHSNAGMRAKDIVKFCPLSEDAQNILKMAITELNFSARAYDRIIKVARTISDLAGVEHIQPDHMQEAIQYRTLDRQFWI